VQRARVLRARRCRAGPEAVARGVQDVRLAGGPVAHGLPVEGAVGIGVGHDLGREHLLVVVEAERAVVLLIPDHPRDLVAGAGERDVRLDAVTARVAVERGVAAGRGAAVLVETVEARLLPAERAHAGRVGGLQAGAGALGSGLLDALGDEDLVVVAGARDVAVLLLPGHPRHGRVARHRGAARHRRVLRLLVGVDVERGNAGPAVLALGHPRVAGGVKAAGEDLLLTAQRLVGLIPRVPRHVASRAREVDRRGLRDGVGVDVQRLALGHPLAVLEGAYEDLLRAAGLLLERPPWDPRAVG